MNLPERKIEIDEKGIVKDVRFKERLEAHKLIEEFMILANVCAAETLSYKKTPTIFRVHEEPDKEKIEALRKTARHKTQDTSHTTTAMCDCATRILAGARGPP